MSTNSTIEWTEATWNPLLGCERVSAGCDNCYAINTATIRAGNPHPAVAAAFGGLTERRDGRLDWTGRINLLPDRLSQPLRWRKPKRIFVNSQSDLFHKDVPNDYIAKVFAVMALAPQHTFQVLTKRHARMRSLLTSPAFRISVLDQMHLLTVGEVAGVEVPRVVAASYHARRDEALRGEVDSALPAWPLPNAWLGVSVEDQKWANVRIPALLDTPAAVRWLSCEPLLGPIDLGKVWRPIWERSDIALYEVLHWIVVGGESGPGSRPMHPEWARALRAPARLAGIPFFFKQHGQFATVQDRPQIGDVWVATDGAVTGWSHGDGHIREGVGEYRWPGTQTVLMRRARTKHDTGRILDGRTWDEYPVSATPAAA